MPLHPSPVSLSLAASVSSSRGQSTPQIPNEGTNRDRRGCHVKNACKNSCINIIRLSPCDIGGSIKKDEIAVTLPASQSQSTGSQSVTRYSSRPFIVCMSASFISNPPISPFAMMRDLLTLLGKGTKPCCKLHRIMS